MKNELLKIISEVKLFLFDLDGVLVHKNNLTDEEKNVVIEELKIFCNELSKLGLKFGIVTARDKDSLITELEKVENIFLISSTLEKVNAVQ
ncbi:MAG: HAD family hydrolase [Ignavibacteria bacterium]|nr:HAD family hydrolase [Ignavibacteria bacterium]